MVVVRPESEEYCVDLFEIVVLDKLEQTAVARAGSRRADELVAAVARADSRRADAAAELVPFDQLFEEYGDEDALEILVDFVILEFLCIQT